ncbi:hypothetical protein HN937_04865 [Candidatus Poribacteria bacterium]|nr:hypothetical protein [Candidatus Poribacteria bacterium]
MARLYRTLMVAADERERVGALSDAAYRVRIALILRADDEGRVRCSAKQVRAWTWGLQDEARRTDEAEAALRELEAACEVQRYAVDGESYAMLEKWRDDQRIDRPTASRLPEPPDKTKQPAETRETSRDLARVPASSEQFTVDVEGDVEGDVDVEHTFPTKASPVSEGKASDPELDLGSGNGSKPTKPTDSPKPKPSTNKPTPQELADCQRVRDLWTGAGLPDARGDLTTAEIRKHAANWRRHPDPEFWADVLRVVGQLRETPAWKGLNFRRLCGNTSNAQGGGNLVDHIADDGYAGYLAMHDRDRGGGRQDRPSTGERWIAEHEDELGRLP